MLKFISFVFFLYFPTLVFCQSPFNIKGKFIEDIKKGDSIYLFSEDIFNQRYFEEIFFGSEIINNHFIIKGSLSYPQMYRVRLKSETDKIPNRNGFYFIDADASSMIIDVKNNIGGVNGKSGKEFKDKFIPYFMTHKTGNLDRYVRSKDQEFDLTLLNYVNSNPSSYVALWFLITRFYNNGYSDLRNKILSSFSEKIKSAKLWKMANEEFHNIRIKDGARFPELLLKNTALNEEVLKVPKGKYVLVDFWFSRCRPCLEQLPYLKEIYKKYSSIGFEIIGISTDLTKNVEPYWKKRIIEKEIPWQNYLDENAKEATQEKIFEYPTNFLLDKDGTVIRKNIDLEDLMKFLEIHLKQPPVIFYDRIKF